MYVYSNGITKPYKSYAELKDVVMEFPGMMSSNNSTKEELVSILKKDNHFYEITSQRKDPKNFEKTVVTVYEVMDGQKGLLRNTIRSINLWLHLIKRQFSSIKNKKYKLC
ncbi:hypothetical protein [Chryseobacterium capnotolerans]|uniref:hypothetical protein n=1 Tax=Chryseobacterium capnotolerans TaxID=2759528 RepID=UPI001E46CB83|nr:hypothetical protein [Chryseobacterium capnotolerans]